MKPRIKNLEAEALRNDKHHKVLTHLWMAHKKPPAVLIGFYRACALQERLVAEEWLAVAMSMLGTIGLGVSSEDAPQEDKGESGLGLGRLLSLGVFFLLLGVTVLYGSRLTNPVRRKSPGGVSTAASVHGLQVFSPDSNSCTVKKYRQNLGRSLWVCKMPAWDNRIYIGTDFASMSWSVTWIWRREGSVECHIKATTELDYVMHTMRTFNGSLTQDPKFHGWQAGVCFGLSAACCKTGLQLISKVGWLSFPVGLAASILMSSLGFMLQTLGLKDGNTIVVCTCAAVASMATGLNTSVLINRIWFHNRQRQ